MVRRPNALPVLVAALTLASAVPTAAQETARRPFAVEDVYLQDGPRDVTVFPGQKRAVYVRQWVDPATRAQRYSLWLTGPAGRPVGRSGTVERRKYVIRKWELKG